MSAGAARVSNRVQYRDIRFLGLVRMELHKAINKFDVAGQRWEDALSGWDRSRGGWTIVAEAASADGEGQPQERKSHVYEHLHRESITLESCWR